MNIPKKHIIAVAALLAAGVLATQTACAKKPAWAAKNDKLIAEKKIAVRTRDDIPTAKLKSNLADGVVTRFESLPEFDLAPGIKARAYWGKGNLVALLSLAPGAAIPKETLPAERIMVVMEGDIEQLLGDKYAEMRAVPRDEPDGTHGRTPKNDFVLLGQGGRPRRSRRLFPSGLPGRPDGRPGNHL